MNNNPSMPVSMGRGGGAMGGTGRMPPGYHGAPASSSVGPSGMVAAASSIGMGGGLPGGNSGSSGGGGGSNLGVTIRLHGLPLTASSADIRKFFSGTLLNIYVHIYTKNITYMWA